jgi:hypothetical protein
MGGNKKARGRASKAKKRGEAAAEPSPPPPPPPPVNHPHRSKAELEQVEAGIATTWRKAQVWYAEKVANLAGTHNFVDRERLVKARLKMAALKEK